MELKDLQSFIHDTTSQLNLKASTLNCSRYGKLCIMTKESPWIKFCKINGFSLQPYAYVGSMNSYINLEVNNPFKNSKLSCLLYSYVSRRKSLIEQTNPY